VCEGADVRRGLWATALPPDDELGAIAHGPVLLGRGGGVVAALRYVSAHPGGLELVIAVRAVDVHADAARRQVGLEDLARGVPPHEARSSELSVTVRLGAREVDLDPHSSTSSAGPDQYRADLAYWIGELPVDDRLAVTTGWPQVGLPPATVELALPGLAALAATAVALR
jgi:hypothetical protein